MSIAKPNRMGEAVIVGTDRAVMALIKVYMVHITEDKREMVNNDLIKVFIG